MKRQSRKLTALLITFCMIVGLIPGSPMTDVTEAADPTTNWTETISGGELLTVDTKNPEADIPKNAGNPYGAEYDPDGTGTGKVMVSWDELAVLKEDFESKTHSLNWYDKDKGSEKTKALEEFASTSGSTPAETNLVYVQSVSFDKSGSGRKDVVAYLGFDTQNQIYKVWTVDTANNKKNS